MRDDLKNLRHTASHLLAAAVLELYPDTKRAIGPSTDEGFYYDFDFKTSISEEDLAKIEAKMEDILKSWDSMSGKEVSASEAKNLFKDEPYKLELIEEFSGDSKTLTVYTSGEYSDLCKGGHSENPREELKAFKLLSVAGAYWRGSEKNKMLTRIYGTAFPSKQELTEYLEMLEEAKKRDHKKLGKELDLFIIDEEVGKGLPLWTPKGTAVKFELINFARSLEKKYGYQHVETPFLGGEALYKTSGHLDHYNKSMWNPIDMDGEKVYLRPMACPHHIKIYQSHQRSYRELPVRFAEVADYARFEKSGELMGMIRVRKFQLTDGHIFVAPENLKEEFKNVVSLIQNAMKGLGIEDICSYRFSKHDPKDQEKYFPDPELWQKAESLMKEALDELEINYYEAIGEAAFYGPKLDIQAKNVNGKEDTLLTAQMDFLLPEKFNLKYIDENGAEKRPVMIHRSTIGSLERIFAFLIEHYGGSFPTWLSPVQVKIIPISEKHIEYSKGIAQRLLENNIRVEIDDRAETMQSKIRDAQLLKIPYMLVLGDREVEGGNITARKRSGENVNFLSTDDFLDKLLGEIKDKK